VFAAIDAQPGAQVVGCLDRQRQGVCSGTAE